MKKSAVNPRTLKICAVGLMGALVFVSTFLNIQIPLPGAETMIHLGNVFCLLSAFILGPVYGGLAAGIGSFLYDLTNPLYIDHSVFTLVFKFMLAFVCGIIAYSKDRRALNVKWNAIAGVCGMLTYIFLHLSETFIHKLLLGVELEAVLLLVGEKAIVSTINAAIAVAVALPLGISLNKLLSKQETWKDMFYVKKK